MERASSIATGRRDVFAAGEDAALTGLERTWADGGYHGFSAGDGIWPAMSSAGEVLTGATPDELDRKIRARWQETQ